ncbi:LysM peptidoglycan-binding domain-containing protein [Acidiferrimicrobium sp. IK]|uniref:LysM peptidoglycan-binding domain-containing protein n=1 Tax=Acidiferrimicrobium sp. IK TaxID=2871700 RepID=UPI0021CB226E|nr:LysM peptidoglycan-binding domain-containing protein [Acidiferrimicrobium sp. IK]MCU4183710.1 LysM peptidoglycan-binding domain-containing protein [Acidiferrimicrobium sp. IK]
MVAAQVARRPYGGARSDVPECGVPTSVVYRRRRGVALAGTALLLIGFWFALQAALGGTGGGPLTATGAAVGTPAAAKVWVVRPGDTLWSIALRSGARGDIRPVVDRLAEETGGQPLQVGERILLP